MFPFDIIQSTFVSPQNKSTSSSLQTFSHVYLRFFGFSTCHGEKLTSEKSRETTRRNTMTPRPGICTTGDSRSWHMSKQLSLTVSLRRPRSPKKKVKVTIRKGERGYRVSYVPCIYLTGPCKYENVQTDRVTTLWVPRDEWSESGGRLLVETGPCWVVWRGDRWPVVRVRMDGVPHSELDGRFKQEKNQWEGLRIQ